MEAWPQTSDSSSPWRHGRNFWFFFFSMEAWPQTSNPLAILRKLLKTSNPTLFQTSYENFSKLPNFYTLPILHSSKLLTKTSQNFLRKLLKTSNPALFQSSRNLTKTSYENFQFLHFWLRKLETSNPLANFHFLQLENLKNLHFWLRNLANFSKLFTKTSYENFSKLPILHSSNPPLLVTKTSNSSTFGYENLKLPILSQTSDSSNLKTWKTLQLPILPYLDFSLMKSWFSATFPQNVCFEQNLVVFPKFAPIFFFWQNGLFFKSPKNVYNSTFSSSTSNFSYFLNNFYFLSLPNSQICLLFAVTSWTSTITRIFSLFLSLCKPKFFSKWKKTTKSGGFCSD